MMTELKRAGGNELRDSRKLSLEELCRGYAIHRDGTCTYTSCDTSFETDVICHNRERNVTAEQAIRKYMQEIHFGTFWSMLELDKTLSGLTEVQKTLLSCIYEGKGMDEIGEVIGISTATMRTHKFSLQEIKREAKIPLALLETLEGEEPPIPRPMHGESGVESSGIEQTDGLFLLNMLHPFSTQFRYK